MSEYEFHLNQTTSQTESGLNPEICAEVGLGCQECVTESARQIATVCEGLRGRSLGLLFTQLYPGAACMRMHAQFAAAYRDASRNKAVFDSELPDAISTAEPDPGFIRIDLSSPASQASKPLVKRGVASETFSVRRTAAVA